MSVHTTTARGNGFGRVLVVLLVAALAVTALGGCRKPAAEGEGPTPSAGGPKNAPAVETTATTAGSGLGYEVPQDVRTQVAQTLAAAGYKFDPNALTISYEQDDQHVNAYGTLAGKNGTVNVAKLVRTGNKWNLVAVE